MITSHTVESLQAFERQIAADLGNDCFRAISALNSERQLDFGVYER